MKELKFLVTIEYESDLDSIELESNLIEEHIFESVSGIIGEGEIFFNSFNIERC